METVILNPTDLTRAVTALREGQLVAFPTETVYGLGADGLSASAVRKIFEAKGRPQDNPLILHVLDQAGLEPLVQGTLPPAARDLIEAFWPGPLTVVVPARPLIPDVVRAGLDTVAVRAPDHPIARSLIAGLNRPIAAPSANVSGRPSPTTAAAVEEDMRGRVPFIVDGGQTRVGVESTVVDCTTSPVTLLRPGGLGVEMLASVVGEVQQASGQGPVRAPGMKYRHYAPKAPVVWVQSHEVSKVAQVLDDLAREYGSIALLAPEGFPPPPSGRAASLGDNDVSAAHRLFQAIRALDEGTPGAIVVVWESDRGLGLAVRNRIEKAATVRVVP
ncbi:MAG: L-threonylcarbamoyladenylate synthase [Firmicutes bacterium]|nr:L-threonylcarbamoyladenylate synthase [Bacillota bacterium]